MSSDTNSNNEEETKRVIEAVMFVSNYYSTKDSNTNLAINDLETTITNLVVMTHWLFQAVYKLIQIQMSIGSPISRVNKNPGELDDVLKRIYA